MGKRFFVSFVLLLLIFSAFSQAGHGVYQFLDLPVSSRLAALGGTNVSLHDNDVNFAFQNPALLTPETNNVISLNMASYLADIKFGSAIYGKTIANKNYFAIGVQYVDYGSFKFANELNDQVGDVYFTAKDLALNIACARSITNKISVGVTLKPVYSAYETYASYGLAMDIGTNFNDSVRSLSVGFVLKNIGTQFKGYYSGTDGSHFEPLPFNIELGVSKKLEHAPLRISLTLQNLQCWDLSYQSTNQSTSDVAQAAPALDAGKSIGFLDMAFRHAVWAAEFLPSKNFYLTIGYNHRRQQEMNMKGFKSMSGFSFGGGVKLYKFQVGFGMTQFQVGNYAYQFSISTSLNEFRL